MYKVLLLEKFDCLGDLDYKLNKDPVVVDYQLVEELVLNVIDCLVPLLGSLDREHPIIKSLSFEVLADEY